MLKTLGIDQSLNGTAIGLLDEGSNLLRSYLIRPQGMTLESWTKMTQWERIDRTVTMIEEIIVTDEPQVVAIEDYARSAHSASLIPLVELGASIKHMLYRHGYRGGRDEVLKAPEEQKLLLVQNQSNMKKFVMGTGAAKKDTAYLLNVMESVGKSFKDDNLADAYMHAWKAKLAVAVVQGRVDISDLPVHQQESLIGEKAAKKKGMSLLKALKLSSAEKLAMVTL